MTDPSNQQGQKTLLQRYPKTTIIGGVILVGGIFLNFLGYLGVFAQLCDFVGISCPGKNAGMAFQRPKTQWIGVRIQMIYPMILPGRSDNTMLVMTDRLANESSALLKNDDEAEFHKFNSGNYEVTLRRTVQDQQPVCLKISGERIPKKSEFMNIIQINRFPVEKNYDELSPESRNQECQKEVDGTQTVLNDPRE
jgi:hypothetical protein